MNFLTEAMSGLGAALLPVAAGLLLEELTLGGLVRLVMIPWTRAAQQTPHNQPHGEQK